MEISVYQVAGLALILVYLYYDRMKKAKRIKRLEAAIRGRRTGRNIPYESLHHLDRLREKAAQWNGSGDNPARLTVTPAQIEALDSYLSHLFSLVPELRASLDHSAGNTFSRVQEQTEGNQYHRHAPLIAPAPDYATRYVLHSLLIWTDSTDAAGRPVCFPCVSEAQAERVAAALRSKGIDARSRSTSSRQTGPESDDDFSGAQEADSDRL